MGDFYSFGTVGDGALRIAQYALIFLSNAKLPYYLCFLPIIVYLVLHRFVKFNDKGPVQIPLIICISSFLLLLPCMNLGSGNSSILDVYATFSNKTIIIDKMGIEHFLFRDLSAFVYKAPEKIEIDTIEDDNDDNTPSNPVIEPRVIDSTLWKNIASQEENTNMQTIDNYLMSQRITQSNEKTGEFVSKKAIGISGRNIQKKAATDVSEFLNFKKERELMDEYGGKVKLKWASPYDEASSLSGGNQQKLLVARWLLAHPDFIIFDEPTRGIDVGAKKEIYTLINELAAAGKGVLVISSELPELFGICDRLLVFRRKRLATQLETAKTTQEEVMHFAVC